MSKISFAIQMACSHWRNWISNWYLDNVFLPFLLVANCPEHVDCWVCWKSSFIEKNYWQFILKYYIYFRINYYTRLSQKLSINLSMFGILLCPRKKLSKEVNRMKTWDIARRRDKHLHQLCNEILIKFIKWAKTIIYHIC